MKQLNIVVPVDRFEAIFNELLMALKPYNISDWHREVIERRIMVAKKFLEDAKC